MQRWIFDHHGDRVLRHHHMVQTICYVPQPRHNTIGLLFLDEFVDTETSEFLQRVVPTLIYLLLFEISQELLILLCLVLLLHSFYCCYYCYYKTDFCLHYHTLCNDVNRYFFIFLMSETDIHADCIPKPFLSISNGFIFLTAVRKMS